ncbi:hypothetical protein PAXINDRAFT_13038 [Paxillus involutus ATCC 200175]|uniref:Uncharacterized protein n=1 Tax=Paxillus involutus ATCC 200175 TaxID=664439 RepID=A0A0C9TEW0_PAXIN|nr:hypothetical protein PAXINDRAFT_13038 [Paxillus involutus ATCC 200175]
MSFLARTYIPIDKLNAITMLDDTIFLEVDGVVPNWNTYSFSIQVVTPGTKQIILPIGTGSPDSNFEGTEVKHEPTGSTALTVKEEDLPETIKGEMALIVKEEDLLDTVAVHTQDLTANILPQYTVLHLHSDGMPRDKQGKPEPQLTTRSFALPFTHEESSLNGAP